jgi:outer membrane immunogenic protein
MREGSAMKKLLLATLPIFVSAIGGTAWSADFPINVPRVVLVPAFSWTSCYAGASLGYGWAHKDVTDPVELVQDLLLGGPVTPALTPVGLSPKGYIVGGQFGCDYQFVGSNWVIGFEGAAIGAGLKGQRTVGLPLDPDVPGNPALVTARTDFLPSGMVRLGYAWDRWLLYATAGAAGASGNYSVAGVFTPITAPTPFNFQGVDLRIGWTAGAGIEWAFCEDWSIKIEYDYYGFGHNTVLMSDNNLGLSAPVDVRQSVQTIMLGLNFHVDEVMRNRG